MELIIYLLIGAIAGFTAGLFGVGGGLIIVPIFSVHDKFHRALLLSGFFFLKIASTFLNSSFFPKPIKRRIAI